MFIKHSILNVLRSWKKSILFLFLIAMLVNISCISIGLSIAIRDFMDYCDDVYSTIAQLEYMGPSYPNELEYDPGIALACGAVDFDAIGSNPATKVWDPSAVALGYIDGISGMNSLAPYKKNAVLVVWIDGYIENERVNSGIISEALYSYDDVEGKIVYVNTGSERLTPGRYYLMHGEFYFGRTSMKYFVPGPFVNACAEQEGFDGIRERMIVDVTAESGRYSIPDDSYFRLIADTYEVINNCVTVHATNDAESLYPFHQQTLYLSEGRFFTEEEYASGARVCIMSQSLAKKLGVGIGGTVGLSLAAQSGCTKNESYWAGSGFDYSDRYTVVGLTVDQKELLNDVFIPKSEQVDLSANKFTYTLGQAILDNDMADRFVSDITPILPDRVRLTVYDQGYSSVARPLKDVLRVILIVSAISVVAGIAVIAMFGFMFVYRQRDPARIMRRLGASKRDIYVYFLFGSGCISLFAVAAGVLTSKAVSDKCTELVGNIVSDYSLTNLMYSSSNLSMTKAIEMNLEIRTFTYIAIGLAILILSVISCCVFAARSFGTHVHRRGRFPFGKSTRSSSLGGGAAKYAWLSVRRGYVRSFIPFAVSLCAAVLLMQLTYTAQLYRTKLDDLNENTVIKGHFADVGGKQIDGLTVFGYVVHDLYRSGMVSEVSMSKREEYLYFGDLGQYISKNEHGSIITIPPASSFAYETYMNRLKQGPGIIFTNDLSSVPEFYYSSSITTQFLDGYDASFLAQKVTSTPSCMVSTHFMEMHGVKLGDTITVAITSGRGYKICDLHVVGSYVKAGKEDNIYCQLGYYISLDQLTDPDHMAELPRSYSFDCVSFTLNDTKNLTAFKEYLANAGYSEVNKLRKIRCFPVLEDHNFLTTQSSMVQRIWYVDHTFPVIYVVVELLAGLVPFILVRLRKREVAIMRSLGASYRTSFFSMFLEQAILCLAGSAAGIAAWLAVNGTQSRLGTMLALIFMTCWLAGTAVSLWNMMVSAVRAILRAEE